MTIFFQKRKKAADELEKAGSAAELSMRRALAGKPAPEAQRRLEALLARLDTERPVVLTRDELQQVRAVEVLERLGTAEARQLLRKLAKGSASALQTRSAQAALDWMAKRR